MRSMLPPSQESGRSGIPMAMPSSAMKNSTLNFTQNKRLSVAGPASRGAPSTHPTPSLNRSQNFDPLLASASKNGQTPLKSYAFARPPSMRRLFTTDHRSTRRGSLWGSGAAVPPPVAAHVLKDTRPLRDRQYQTKMRQDIVNWLGGTEYDISMQTLTNMTGKDYRNVFQFLLSMLDPGYLFDPQVRFEDEFVSALKCVQYPFVGQVDPKWLAAPASMHSWPSLLGVLHWLVCMCKVRREVSVSFRRFLHHSCREDWPIWTARILRYNTPILFPRNSITLIITLLSPSTTSRKLTKSFARGPTTS
jgi:kinetochore protein NDC80